MEKQSKITIKHFLNTNLKPYFINKIGYYSVYILLTAHRQNTRVKSIALNEFYSDNDFEEIVNSINDIDKNIISEETSTLEIITKIVIEELKDFDTHFITTFFNFSENINIYDIDVEMFKYNKEVNFYYKDKNKAGINLDRFIFKENNLYPNIKLYRFYGKENQNNLKNFLIETNCKTDIEKTINSINKMFFYRSFDKFKWFLGGSKRNKELLQKHKTLFNDYNDIISILISEDYGVL